MKTKRKKETKKDVARRRKRLRMLTSFSCERGVFVSQSLELDSEAEKERAGDREMKRVSGGHGSLYSLRFLLAGEPLLWETTTDVPQHLRERDEVKRNKR